MPLFDWLRPARHLVVLFAAMTLLPVGALVWLGWQFFDRDRAFEEQQIRQRLEASAERVTTGIVRALESAARELPAWLANPPEVAKADVSLIRFGPAGSFVKAGAPLLFAPSGMVPTAVEPPFDKSIQQKWAEAEALQYRDEDFEGAAAAFKALAATQNSQIRAAALIGAARNLRNLGQKSAALDLYRSLLQLTNATVHGEPADLAGRIAEIALLDELGRKDEASQLARQAANDLASGKWWIDAAAFDARVADVRGWTPFEPDAASLARAEALDSAWTKRQAGERGTSSSSRGHLVIWHAAEDDVIALVGDAKFLMRALEPTLKDLAVRVSLENPGGLTVRLRAADVQLPWDLFVTDPTAAAGLVGAADRRRLLGWSLVVLVILVPATGYVVFRAVQKELAVSRLQADFVSAVSHEFRTPLTSMSHLTEMLRDDASITEERRRQYYGLLVRDTDRLKRFVETLLDFGRMEAGATSVQRKDEDLGRVVSEVVAEFRAESAASGREVHVETTDAGLTVQIDREAFGRALWNLLDNASKYSPAGTPIVVSIRTEKHVACIDVIDRGAGIPQNERRQIFEKFVRGDLPKAVGIKGTGVGLALVDRIIRAHGGEVRLDSVVGQGSTFSLILPIAGEVRA